MGVAKKDESSEITLLLRDYQGGNERALDALLPLVYERLKRIAAHQMKAQSGSHTLSPTALVHEAFLKLQSAEILSAKDRSHFFAIAAQTMRWLLVDFARAKTRDKRGGKDGARVVFNEAEHAAPDAEGVRTSALAEALEKLEKLDPRLCKVVELHGLVGLTIEETAQVLGIAPRTVKRDWVTAKAWLVREMKHS